MPTTHTQRVPADTGLTLYAYPMHQSLADWATHRVVGTEASAPNLGRYVFDLDSANGVQWAIFSGASQPAGFYDALDTFTLALPTVASGLATGGLPVVDANGRTSANVTNMATGVITADSVAADAGTEIATATWANATRTLSGTIQTLDALDTAQDSQHTSTQSAVNAIGGNVTSILEQMGEFGTTAGQQMIDWFKALMGAGVTKPTGAPASYDPAEHSLEAQADAIGAVGSAVTPALNRANYDAAWQLYAVSRRDGTYRCDRPVRPNPGAIDTNVSVDMSKLWGKNVKVANVTNVSISGGSITVPTQYIRETTGMTDLAGTATASESRTVTMRIHSDNGLTEWVTFEIEVGE